MVDELETQNTEQAGVSEASIPMVSPLQAYPLEQLQVKGVWIHRSGEARP